MVHRYFSANYVHGVELCMTRNDKCAPQTFLFSSSVVFHKILNSNWKQKQKEAATRTQKQPSGNIKMQQITPAYYCRNDMSTGVKPDMQDKSILSVNVEK